MKRRNIIAAILVALAQPLPLLADDAHHKGAPSAGQPAGELSEGEVRKVDRDAKKITIRHGPLKNLDMPGMTMVFQVSDPAMLDKVKPGDRIRFLAEKSGGAYVVKTLETAKQ